MFKDGVSKKIPSTWDIGDPFARLVFFFASMPFPVATKTTSPDRFWEVLTLTSNIQEMFHQETAAVGAPRKKRKCF